MMAMKNIFKDSKGKKIHDLYCKDMLDDKESLIEFLIKFLPAILVKLLDLKSVELMSDSFVDESVSEHLSDKLIRVRLKGFGEIFIYVLLEHKSSSDKWVALQLLRYLVQFWEKMRREGAKTLPFVFPMVFYNGKNFWRYKPKFSALFDMKLWSEFKEFLPDFKFHLCDTNKVGDEELKGYTLLSSSLLVMKHFFQDDVKEKFGESLELLRVRR
jgi:predicted transposase/invertase (TIGR01784 family)